MTVFLAICSAVLFLTSLGLMFLYGIQNKGVKELKEKTDFALSREVLMKVEMNRGGLLSQIASNFNLLIKTIQSLSQSKSTLEKESGRLKQMDSKLKDFEESISQISLLVDVGMQITSSLDIDEVLKKVHNFVSSSMNVDEIELLHFTGDKKSYRTMNQKGKLVTLDQIDDKDKESVLNWTIENKKEVLLNDAENDYGQYVFKPIIGLSGSRPGSLVCIPLILHNKHVGAIAVSSLSKNAYNRYHVDFIRGIASYISVALDNSNVYSLLNLSKNEIESEKEKSDTLLLNILPSEVAEELKQKGYAEAKKFNHVSVLFSDFENFTGISEQLSPEDLVNELNIFFKAFDNIMEKYELEKIKTIGDAYMAAGGMSESKKDSIEAIVLAGLEMQEFVTKRRAETNEKGKPGFSMRVGIHTGQIVAGIVGEKKFQYDIWGDTVNTASRMESSGEVGKVNISDTTYTSLKKNPAFKFENRGEVSAKHKGEITMYFVDRA